MRTRGGLIAAIVVMLATTSGADPRPRVLHEDIETPASSVPRALGPAPRAGQNPAAFAATGKLLPEPATDQPPGSGEPTHGSASFAADRQTQSRPDYRTGPDAPLQYVTVFNPSVVPFKRMSALDAVQPDYTLRVGSSALVDLPIGGTTDADRDVFWGSLVLELEPGRDVAIPSVAPDMRVLSYEIEPRLALTFSKDDADNYFVRSDESAASGVHRLVFMVDADASYFAPSVPRGYRVRDVARLSRSLARPLPADLRAEAAKAARSLRISAATPLPVALDRLARYFRGFEARPAPPPSGNIYRDLFYSQAGVCRHRSFAFMVTAAGLGIPVRYVTNEAHAFVEVWAPEVGWMRMDLGGASPRLDVRNAADKTLHQPRRADPFAQPPGYRDDYTQLAGDIRGLSAEQLAEAQTSRLEPAEPDDAAGRQDRGTTSDAAPERRDPEPTDSSAADAPAPPPAGEDEVLPSPTPPTRGKAATRIVVETAASRGFRGEPLLVRGRLEARDATAAELRVDVYLAPSDSGGSGARLLGHGLTRTDGSFELELELPADLELRDYEVFAATPGDAERGASVSR